MSKVTFPGTPKPPERIPVKVAKIAAAVAVSRFLDRVLDDPINRLATGRIDFMVLSLGSWIVSKAVADHVVDATVEMIEAAIPGGQERADYERQAFAKDVAKYMYLNVLESLEVEAASSQESAADPVPEA